MKSLKLLCLGFFLLYTYQMIGQEKSLTLEKLPFNVNSHSYDEISPVLSLDGKTLYFTRVGHPDYNKTLIENGQDLSKSLTPSQFNLHLQSVYTQIAKKIILNPETSGFNQDIWIAETSTTDFDKVSHPGYPLNNALPNSVSALTPSSNEIIVINQFIEQGGMQKGFSVVRQFSDETWSFPEAVTIEDYYTNEPDVSMTMSHDGAVMILSLERNDSYGKSDLYVSFREGDKKWSKPKNLGPQFNTIYKESTPFLSEDKTKLFFSSNRRGTMGGNDIFIIERLDDTWQKWSDPRRFVEPINSEGDDSQPFFNSATGFLYFTSMRDGTSDIFRVKIAPAIPLGVAITGKILNAKTHEPVSANVLSSVANLDHFKNAYVSDDGTFTMTIPKGKEFTLIAEKTGYKGKAEKLFFKENYFYFKKHEVILYVEPLDIGAKIPLDAIYFKQSEPTVLSKSYPALNNLADFLKTNQSLYIRIDGHTDNQGDEDALIKLSKQRADAIKEYLVYKKGIHPLRVETKGFGASQPVNDNSTDELRKANRRVEVEIVEVSKKK